MKTIYKAKIGIWLLIIISIVFASIIFEMFQEKNWIGILIPITISGFILHMVLTTKYTIENDNLNVKCGFLYNQNIDIKTIRKVSETNNILSSPAPSIDRLEIIYNKFDSVLVSPKDKLGFINHLKNINPIIEVKYKK